MRATATVRDLIEEKGPALPPGLAVAVARCVLAELDPGPFESPPRRSLPADGVLLEETRSGALRARFDGPASMHAVGELLYEMLAGGPIRVPKDRPDAPPRPLGKLREFLGGGPVPAGLEAFVGRLLAEDFESAENAITTLDELKVD